MGCPCKNPPGASNNKSIVVRNPHTLQPISPDAPLSREDIRNGRTRRIIVETDASAHENATTSARRKRSRAPMSGFLADTLRLQ